MTDTLVREGFSESLFKLGQFFGLFRSRLYPLELALIRRVLGLLPTQLRSTIEKQFESYNHFERDGWWRQLSMRRKVGGRISFPEDLKIAAAPPDTRLASVKFRVPGGGDDHHVVLHVVRGHLFTAEFGSPYYPIRFAADIDIVSHRINATDFSANAL